jgi:hypothetical protein
MMVITVMSFILSYVLAYLSEKKLFTAALHLYTSSIVRAQLLKLSAIISFKTFAAT